MDKVLANAEIKTMINAFWMWFSEGYDDLISVASLSPDHYYDGC